jgi:hypothetical protein
VIIPQIQQRRRRLTRLGFMLRDPHPRDIPRPALGRVRSASSLTLGQTRPNYLRPTTLVPRLISDHGNPREMHRCSLAESTRPMSQFPDSSYHSKVGGRGEQLLLHSQSIEIRDGDIHLQCWRTRHEPEILMFWVYKHRVTAAHVLWQACVGSTGRKKEIIRPLHYPLRFPDVHHISHDYVMFQEAARRSKKGQLNSAKIIGNVVAEN